MPTGLVKKLAAKKGVSIPAAEKEWEEGKRAARKAGLSQSGDKERYWAYTTTVFKRRMGESEHITETKFDELLNKLWPEEPPKDPIFAVLTTKRAKEAYSEIAKLEQDYFDHLHTGLPSKVKLVTDSINKVPSGKEREILHRTLFSSVSSMKLPKDVRKDLGITEQTYTCEFNVSTLDEGIISTMKRWMGFGKHEEPHEPTEITAQTVSHAMVDILGRYQHAVGPLQYVSFLSHLIKTILGFVPHDIKTGIWQLIKSAAHLVMAFRESDLDDSHIRYLILREAGEFVDGVGLHKVGVTDILSMSPSHEEKAVSFLNKVQVMPLKSASINMLQHILFGIMKKVSPATRSKIIGMIDHATKSVHTGVYQHSSIIR
jgi:hypothetical protein